MTHYHWGNRSKADYSIALETLVGNLQSHLQRLTSELSEHRQLLTELRTFRDQDVIALQEKSRDINRLKDEVERLSGEVEVLRGVVEENLKERREIKERSILDVSSSSDVHSDHDDEDSPRPKTLSVVEDPHSSISDDTPPLSRSTTPTQLHPQARSSPNVETAAQTAGDTSRHSERYIDEEEVDRLSMEIEERRSERSLSRSLGSPSRLYQSRSQPLSPLSSPLRRSPAPSTSSLPTAPRKSQDMETNTPLSPVQDSRQQPNLPEQRASTPIQVNAGPQKPQDSGNATLPEIRGSTIERLFYAAPQHDTRACTRCHRSRRSHDVPHVPSAAASVSGLRSNTSNVLSHERGATTKPSDDREQRAKDDKLPPQTVLARVLRELEDDFTHYKACVATTIVPKSYSYL